MGWLTSTTAHGQVEAGLALGAGCAWRACTCLFGCIWAWNRQRVVEGHRHRRDCGRLALGSDVGLRIHRRLKDGWTLGGGVEWIRREHDIVVVTPTTLGLTCTGHVATDAQFGLSIPFSRGHSYPLGWNDLEVQSSLGLGVEWKTSETVVSQLVQTPGQDHIVQAYQGRTRTSLCLSLPKSGFNDGPEATGWYVGWHWSSPLGRSAWAENTWASGSTARDWHAVYLNLVVNTGPRCSVGACQNHKKARREWAFSCFLCSGCYRSVFGHEVESNGEVVVNEVVAQVVEERTRSVLDVKFSAVQDAEPSMASLRRRLWSLWRRT